MTNITPILEAVITLAVALCTTFLIPWIKSKVDAEKLNTMLSVVDIAVAAAEQLSGALGLDGEAKKEYVVNFLAEHGYTIDAELNVAIEAAVLALHEELKANAE